jgi:hypothetical protein
MFLGDDISIGLELATEVFYAIHPGMGVVDLGFHSLEMSVNFRRGWRMNSCDSR